jgi:uncharacterized protein YndB with AHSA1/START domain
MKQEIKQNWFFQQPPREVWEYLTKPELIEQWLMKTDFKPVVGYRFQFLFTPKEGSKYDGTVNCEVLEVKPFTRLVYSWAGKTKEGGRHFNSTVVWTLVPNDNGTELQLQHTGFTVLEDILNHESGWQSCLRRFEEIITENRK